MATISINMTGKLYDNSNINDACDIVISYAFPRIIEPTIRMLVWGFRCLKSALPATTIARYSSTSDISSYLYLSGWGILQFEGVCGGNATITPYKPSLETNLVFGPDPQSLSHRWNAPEQHLATSYPIWAILEQPLGTLVMTIDAVGPVTLWCESNNLIYESEAECFPERYKYDFRRVRQLADLCHTFGLNYGAMIEEEEKQ